MVDSIKPRERDAIIQSLRAGVVPRVGLRHLQVRSLAEVATVLDDPDRIARRRMLATRSSQCRLSLRESTSSLDHA